MKPSLEYLAGFFDGEGCITILDGHNTNAYYLVVSISQVNTKVLKHFAKQFGGQIRGPIIPAGNRKPQYQWRIEAKLAENCIRQLNPYLINKSQHAKVALKFRTYYGVKYRIPLDNPKRKEKILDLREVCFQQLVVLNKRGI